MNERVVTLGEVGDLTAIPGSRPWVIGMKVELQGRATDWERDREATLRLLAAFDHHEGWRQLSDAVGEPFDVLETFLGAARPYGLELDDDRVRVAAAAVKATTLGSHGGKREPEQVDHRGQLARPLDGGNRNFYLLGRIARDHPDIHARMKAGEFTSIRSAAIAAGIVKPRQRPRMVSVPIEAPERAAALLRRRLAPADLAALIAALQGEEDA